MLECFHVWPSALESGRMRTKFKSQKGVGHFSEPSRGKTLKRCKNNGNTDNIVIDIDDDDDDNHINNVLGKDRRCPIPIIICSDEEDEISNKNQHATSVEAGAGFASDASSSSRSPPSSNQNRNNTDVEGDECRFLHEIESPVKLSKCKRTYCAKAPSRSRYGLGFDLDSDQSDKDQLDSDYMEDNSGEIQAEWERANKRKKGGIFGGESVKDAQPTTSGARQKVEVEKESETGSHSKDRFHPNLDKVSSKEKTTSHSADAEMCRCVPAFHKKTPFADCKLGKSKASDLFKEVPFFRTQHPVDLEVGNVPPSCSFQLPNEIRSRRSNSNKENFVLEQHLFPNRKSTGETRVGDDLAGKDSEAASWKCAGKHTPTAEQNHDYLVDSEFEALHRESAGKAPPWGIPDLREREQQHQEKVNPVPKEPFLENTFTRIGAESEPNGSAQQEDNDGPLQDEASGGMDTLHDCFINSRENLKETDAYKQAAEEEWASRQQALRLQAEEAQKMRQVLRRKKAESLRLLDMERRQKQRVEEIRETQKKDEVNMNIKEKLRAEVRIELKQLELKSLDMGSLLRALGVHVNGGIQPQPHEIRAAYKKALLSFHPDRAPASDIRKLVEAEEKFKLISRMKEKFLSTS